MWQHEEAMHIDAKLEVDRISEFIKAGLSKTKREGAVIGLSGGIDSAVCAEILWRALGKDRVLAVILPERESNPISREYALRLAEKRGLRVCQFDITEALEQMGVYNTRDDTIRNLVPDYQRNDKSRITLPSDLLAQDAYNYFTLQLQQENGQVRNKRLDGESLRKIVAATNIKQRIRMVCLYYYAELNNYFVCGTTNKTEFIQGFFVKYGDGGVDIEPIVHLYKMQVYQLARHLDVSEEIILRAPSPDTFSYSVTDEEMYFRMPYEVLDPLLFAWEHSINPREVSSSMHLQEKQVERAFRDFRSKFNATKYQRLPVATMETEITPSDHNPC
jgi:NAD+ synthase